MAISGLNVNNLTVDDKGRVSFSGLGSGIDFQGTVDKIIAARRIPVDTLETRVTANEDKIAALKELRTHLQSMQTSLSKLYGAVSFGNTANIFEAKDVFASVTRLDGGTPSAAGTLVGATVTNAASAGVHTIEVLRTAKAHKVSSDSFASATTALGLTAGSTFTIEGTTITVTASDSLNDLRDRINAANRGSSATGVTASVVSVGTTEHYLLLTKDDTGASMALADTSGTALQSLGILTGGGAVKNQIQAAQTAQFYADGILDQTNTIYETELQDASTSQIGSSGTLRFTRDSDSAVLGSVAYNSGDSLATLASNINAAGIGITATVVTDGAGVRLELSGAAGFSIDETGAGTAIADLGIDNKRRVIERDSNTVDDLFTGVTLTLYQAEKGTTIQLEVERDLSQVKTEITNFVSAYNELREFINGHRLLDTTSGTKSEEAGVLYSSSALADVTSKISAILGAGTTGVSSAYSVLAQIGIEFVPINGDDPLLAETLEIDESKLDEALLNNPDDVRRLFTFDMTSSDARVSLLGFNQNTTYNAGGYTLNVLPVEGGNLLQRSQEADNAYWTAQRATISADGTLAPDGTNTADGLVADATNNTHYLTNTAGQSLTAGESYIFSTYVKAGDNSNARIAMGGAAFGGSLRADFDLASGTVTSSDAGVEAANIEDVGGGWYRVSMKATAVASSTAFFERYSKSAGISYTGDGATVNTWFWGAQVEPADGGTTPTVYVPTTTAAITAGTANIDGTADGADDGSATVSGSTITVNSGGAEGLRLFFDGLTGPTSVDLDFTIGIGAQLYFAIQGLLDTTTGSVETEIDTLTDQNEVANDRITEMLNRLEIQRASLIERFLKMEQAMATAERIMDSIKQTTDAMFGSKG